jgi:Ca2+-binding RTX toxin-like protein
MEVSLHRSLTALALVVAGLAAAPPAHAVPTCGGKAATMVFGDGDDVVSGTDGDDVVVLGGGDDVYQNDNGGDDTVCAGPGDDAVSAVSPGADVIDLGSGDDWRRSGTSRASSPAPATTR